MEQSGKENWGQIFNLDKPLSKGQKEIYDTSTANPVFSIEQENGTQTHIFFLFIPASFQLSNQEYGKILLNYR